MSFTRFNGGGGGATSFSRFLQDDGQDTDPYSPDKINKQIDNASLRIQDAGFNVANSDQRNAFEKFTNLPEKQNWFLDTLELLGRGGNAVKNVIDKTANGNQDIGTSLYRGFSGRENVSGVDLAKKAGIDNKVGQFIVGTGLDIGLDPLTYVPGGVIAKGVGAVAKPIAGAAKVGYNAIEEAAPALKALRETRLEPAFNSAKDSLGYMFNRDYGIQDTLTGNKSDFLKNLDTSTEASRKFLQEENAINLARTAKAAGGVDTGTDVGRIVEAPLKQFEDVKAYEFPDGLTRTENKHDLFDAINTNRDQIKGIGKEINGTKKDYQSAIGEMAGGLNKTDSEIRKLYLGLEKDAAKGLDQQARSNLRDAGREMARIDSQLNNFGKVEGSMLRNYSKQVVDSHESNFDIIRQVKETAPNGIKGVDRSQLPTSLQNFVREGGKGIDEVANELGYKYADDLLQDLKVLNNVPRKLDKETVNHMARQEMERAGAVKHLEDQFNSLVSTRNTLQSSIKEIQNGFKKNLPIKASEKAFGDLANNPRYNELTDQRNTLKSQLDSLKGESKQARSEKVDIIKKIEKEIVALKEASRNPVMLQKELPRPQRELNQDPKVQQAAKALVSQNKEIVDLAQQNGIDIPELEGHMYHILSQEERAYKKTQGAKGTFLGSNQPSKSILNNRQYMGSAEDINDKTLAKTGRRKFEDNAYFAQGIGQQRLVDYIHAVSFRRQVLSNPEFARPFVKGMDIPKNAEVIDMNNYKFLKESGDTLEGIPLKEEIGGQYVVTKSAKMLLDNYKRLNTDEGTKSFLKAFDGVQSFWKRFTLFSPGYHVRNLAGAMFNNSVAGMSVPDLAKYTTDAGKEVMDALKGTESALFNEYRKQGLSSSGLSQVEFARAGQEPEEAIRKTIENMSKEGMDKVKSKALHPFQTSQELGDVMDQTNRFALYKWAREKKGMTPEEAALKVKEVQFDYSKLSPFEKNVMTRVVPFYRWMKNNIPFQIRSFINDPRKYEWMNKARLNAQDAVGLNEQNMPDYMKESFAYPVFGQNGQGKMLGLNLPLGDLTKLSDPLKLAVDGLTPLIKTPIELSTNFNMFYKKPIEKFAGQEKQYQLGPLEGGIPIKAAYALEQATGQIGRGLSGYLQKPETQDQDTTFRLPTLGINSMLKPFDAEKNAKMEQLQKLKALQDYLLYIQQQTGEKPRTVNEIRR